MHTLRTTLGFGRLPLQLYCCNMNIFPKTGMLTTQVLYTWYRDSLGQRLLDLCVVSAESLRSVLDVCVKRVQNCRPIITWGCLQLMP